MGEGPEDSNNQINARSIIVLYFSVLFRYQSVVGVISGRRGEAHEVMLLPSSQRGALLIAASLCM